MSRGRIVDFSLAAFCAAMLVTMWVFPGQETIPYHFLFLALAIVYGFRVWPIRPTVVVMVGVTLATGLLFARALRGDYIGIDEMSEVLLMPLLLMAMVWHARRREAAIQATRRMAALHHALLEREHELLRDTSHAIRTPVTIARGFLELALDDPAGPDLIDNLEVISRQLQRTETLSSRLLSLSALDPTEHRSTDMIDLAAVVRSVSQNWAAAEDRHWVHDTDSPVWILGDVVELQSAVDALIENAIHFTCPEGTIRVSCRKDDGCALIEVADSGTGIREADLPFVFQRFWHRTPPDGIVGSGLGLSMVAAVCEAHGATVSVGTAPEGGALFAMTFPRPTVGVIDHQVPESVGQRAYGPTARVMYHGAPVESASSSE